MLFLRLQTVYYEKSTAILCGKACEEFENEGFQLTRLK